jgi:hypothetical protein
MVLAGDPVRASDVAKHGCRLTRTGNLNVPNITDTFVPFNEEVFDYGGLHSNVTNPNRITFVKSGVYLVGGGVQLSASTAYTNVSLSVRMNGSVDIVFERVPGTTTSASQLIATSTVYEFDVGDYIELVVFQSSAAARTLELVGEYSPQFYAAFLGS